MSAASQLSDEHTLYVVMNGRAVGDINRSGKDRARLRYQDAATDANKGGGLAKHTGPEYLSGS